MPPDRGAVARRDAGLHRVSRLTRWLLAGGLALTGACSAVAAHAFPGHTTAQTTGSAGTSSTGQSSQASTSGSGQSAGSALQAPATVPSASGGSGSVTSGGS